MSSDVRAEAVRSIRVLLARGDLTDAEYWAVWALVRFHGITAAEVLGEEVSP